MWELNMSNYSTTLLLSLLLVNSTAYAWGPEGHAIVADIAEAHLNEVAKNEVRALLAQEGNSNLDDIASWPDQSPPKTPLNARWHYVDIPLEESQYSASRDCPQSACVVAKISSYAQTLADTTLDNGSRLEALKWLVHFIGDIHQPLHAANHNDRGGNQVSLSYYEKNTNLHSIWDGAILEHALNLHLGPHYSFNHTLVRQAATDLDSAISSEDRNTWSQPGLLKNIDSTAIAWAEESHALARIAYNSLPNVMSDNWEDNYQSTAWPVARKQLQKAGLHLSVVLNEALQSDHKTPHGKFALTSKSS
jgi:hypothetical protein